MSWFGAITGGIVGGMLLGPIGMLLGGVVGNMATKDKHREYESTGIPEYFDSPQERRQLAFFVATFSVLGYIAKLDGRVSKAEIQYAESIIRQLSLSESQREAAIEFFSEGKEEYFDLEGVLEQLYTECNRDKSLMRMFFAIQIQGILSSGDIDSVEMEALRNIAHYLYISDREFEQMLHAEEAAISGHDSHSIKEDYEILGIDSDADDAEVKRAYRRMMSRYHPDRLVSKGLPDELMELAKEKTQEIKAAYERIKKSRK